MLRVPLPESSCEESAVLTSLLSLSQIAAAGSVVVVGGGSVGVEVVAEVAEAHPGKKARRGRCGGSGAGLTGRQGWQLREGTGFALTQHV